jgi:chromosome partitioning protein
MAHTTTITLFNNKGGVGKTSLLYHLAWMFSEKISVLAVDLDPQANLTSMFISDERVEQIWENQHTMYDYVAPLITRSPQDENLVLEKIRENLHLIPGSLQLSSFEDELSENWTKSNDEEESAIGAAKVVTAFHEVIQRAARQVNAQLILIDVGPSLGATNRSALIASDYILIPLAPDLFSLQGLKNLGPTLQKWRRGWQKRKDNEVFLNRNLDLPAGKMQPIGYVLMNFGVRDNRVVQAYERWLQKIPQAYNDFVLNSQNTDNHQLAQLKNYRSLMPMAQEKRKPMFYLRSSDGAIGAQQTAVNNVRKEFITLAQIIATKINLDIL